jgi:hypothetical protein
MAFGFISNRLSALAGLVERAGGESSRSTLVVAEQFTNQVSVFTRDRSTGLLIPTENKYPVTKASCIVFV